MWGESTGTWVIWLYSIFFLLEQGASIGAGTKFGSVSLFSILFQCLILSPAGADTAMEK